MCFFACKRKDDVAYSPILAQSRWLPSQITYLDVRRGNLSNHELLGSCTPAPAVVNNHKLETLLRRDVHLLPKLLLKLRRQTYVRLTLKLYMRKLSLEYSGLSSSEKPP